MTMRRTIAACIAVAIALAAMGVVVAEAQDCCDPKSPFRKGEGHAETPATCETLAAWAKQAPKTDARISFSIRGRLSEVNASDTLAYLEMCPPGGLQVVCVTYKTNGMKAGDVVSFAGGYQRRSDKWVMLDPCLASRG